MHSTLELPIFVALYALGRPFRRRPRAVNKTCTPKNERLILFAQHRGEGATESQSTGAIQRIPVSHDRRESPPRAMCPSAQSGVTQVTAISLDFPNHPILGWVSMLMTSHKRFGVSRVLRAVPFFLKSTDLQSIPAVTCARRAREKCAGCTLTACTQEIRRGHGPDSLEATVLA